MDLDDILIEIGELGRFQVTIYLLVCLPVVFAAANSLTYIFVAGEPDYRCYIPECESVDSTNYDSDWVKWAVPPDNRKKKTYSTCSRYKINKTVTNSFYCTKEMFTNKIESCNEWIFDPNERTILNDWNLVCASNEWKLAFAGTTHFLGIVVGSVLFGILSDRFGRKIILVICNLLMSISGVIEAFCPEYISFIIFVFINAFMTSGIYPVAFTIGVEMVGKKQREFTGMVLCFFFAVGEAMVGLIAWLFKDWVILQLAISAPPIVFVGYYWIIPESVRWLLAHNENDKAKEIICRAAKINKVTVSEALLESFKGHQLNPNVEANQDVEILPVIKEILTTRKLFIRFVIVYFIWIVNGFVYYGLSLNSTSIGGDKYLNFSLVCLIEIPGYIIAWICIKKLGRKISLIGSLFLSGLTCTLTAVVPLDMNWVCVSLFLVGKLGMTASFSIIYVYTAELLPTIIRNGGVGTASTTGSAGAALAQFVPLLAKPWPMIIFGVLGLIAGVLSFKLPETKGKKLPDTVEEAEKL